MLPWVLLGVAVFCLALGAGRARFGFGSEPFLSADRFWGRAALVVLGAGCLLWVATAQGVSIDVVFDGVNVRYSFRERVVAEQFAAANRSSVEDGRQPPPSSPQHDPDELEDHGEAAIGISGDED